MPKKPNLQNDRRSRKDLEAFLLGLITQGLKTPYDFMISAGISPGASIPALTRLEDGGYIRKGDEGPRNRTEYIITANGERFLSNSCREMFKLPPTSDRDLETVLRISALALMLGQPQSSVATYLKTAAQLRRASASTARPTNPKRKDLSETFSWMRMMARSERMRQEAALLQKLATSVKRMK